MTLYNCETSVLTVWFINMFLFYLISAIVPNLRDCAEIRHCSAVTVAPVSRHGSWMLWITTTAVAFMPALTRRRSEVTMVWATKMWMMMMMRFFI